ncbi:autotransporter assembly complex protein TamA [Hydrogenophaga pseudoflava]|uniref:autotransporter assembly complex protein TamA n=1 Tax=Hydrogenophaga pseudoflava TaxID=47421 RepID=UPI0027E4888D|nr:BamA/TamA family outer membrane protein [Hydrogenophaga pseudoflava]MDQ7744898.1 BamA/TamA family outer membrane protein [Hydrogenophaga pseudoflava]
MTLTPRRRVASTRLFCLLSLLLPGLPLQAAEPGHGGPPETSDARTAPERFAITLQAPGDLQAFLLRHIELQRYRHLTDLDSGELDRLLLAAPDNLRQLLGTQGFFSSEVEVTRRPGGPALGEVLIRIEPGRATRVTSSAVYFSGDIASHAGSEEQRETVRRRSQQAVGQTFSQAAWDRTKSDTLRLLSSERYPRARIANSLSDIDAIGHAAHWHIELDSGAPVQIGDVRVEGAERYDPRTVERLVRLAGLRPGADYSLSRLQDAQQHIADTGYYSSVFAYVDLDQAGEPGTPAPVVVQVREAPLQKVVLGIGGSTNNGPRLSAEHQHLRMPLLGWQARSKLQLERNDQLLSTDWSAPVEDDGWHWLTGGRLARQIDGDSTVSSLRLSLGKAQNSPRMDRRYFVQYDRARTVNTALASLSSDGNEAAVSVNYGWTWRRFDQLPFPQSGYGLGLTLGAGTTLGSERKPFLSTQARWLAYWPLDRLPSLGTAPMEPGTSPPPSRNGRLALRLQGGALLADTTARIPDTQLFLTGGDNTVRGYGLRDIGVPQADGSVAPGRYMAVASFEWQRPIWRGGVRTDWEGVLFADAGIVTNQPAHTSPKVGVGAGLRYNSPVGPLQLDLAYGLGPKRLRVHLNVGFSF